MFVHPSSMYPASSSGKETSSHIHSYLDTLDEVSRSLHQHMCTQAFPSSNV